MDSRSRSILAQSLGLALLVALGGCGARTLATGGDADAGGAVPDTLVVERADQGAPKMDMTVLPGPSVWISTNRPAYGTSEQVLGTVHNDTEQTIFLAGCAIFGRQRREAGSWVEVGPAMMCGWEGLARPVDAHATTDESSRFELPGQWRLSLRYGVGCAPDKPLSAASCAAMHEVLSAPIDVKVDAATCNAINAGYKSKLDAARKCTGSEPAPCAALVAGDLSCGCPLYVNDTKSLASSQQRWQDLRCHELMPPCGIDCAAPPPAVCANGTCTYG